MRQEGLPVQGEPDTARSSSHEQTNSQRPLQRRDPLGHSLLGDSQVSRRLLELSKIRHGDERAHEVKVHPGSLHNQP